LYLKIALMHSKRLGSAIQHSQHYRYYTRFSSPN